MHMLALPIARRELLVLSRATATWQGRLISSLAVFGFGVGFAYIYHYFGPLALNRSTHVLGAALSLMCLFTGVALTADSIAQEKRDGTLGLLFLTNLSSFEIVIGKLVAHGALGFYTVLCAFPLLSMTMIFGGMRLADVLLYVISALNLLFFSAAIGLLASSFSEDKKKAHSLGILILLLFWLGLPGFAVLLSYTGGPSWLIDVLARLSVNSPSSIGFGVLRLLPSTSTAWNLAWTHILAWAFIALTVFLLPRCWLDQPHQKTRTWRQLWTAISLGTPAARLKLRRKLLDRNAFMWLASRARLETAAVWFIKLSMLAVLATILINGTLEPGILIAMGVAISGMLQLAFSAAAGAQLFREYEQGTLELILSTPLSVHEVLRGQFAAARKQYRTLITLTFLLLWVGVAWLACQGARRALGISILAVYSGLFLLNFYALGWVGMWCVVKATEPKRALTTAFLLVTMLPGLIFGLINACVQLLIWLTGWRFSVGPELGLPLLLILLLGNCLYWLQRAKRELPGELRPFAFRRYAPHERPTLFGRLGRFAGRCLHRLHTRAPRKAIPLNSP